MGSASETDLLLVEYTALRSEINLTMQSRNTILTFGFAALGVLAAAAFLAQHSPDTFTIILVLGMGAPALSTMILALWLAELSGWHAPAPTSRVSRSSSTSS